MTQQLQTILDTAWDERANFVGSSAPKEVLDAVDHVIHQLNTGQLRVATQQRSASGAPTNGSRRPCC